MGASINIEALDEGFLIEDESGKKSAIASAEQLIRKIKAHFGLTRNDSGYVKVGDRGRVSEEAAKRKDNDGADTDPAMTGDVKPERRVAETNLSSKIETTAEVDAEAKGSPGSSATVVCLQSDDIAPPAKASMEKPETQAKELGSTPRGAASDFVFRECEQFKWSSLPTFRAGKTIYHLLQGKVHITREGYGPSVQVWAELDDLKRLRVLDPDELKIALEGLHKGRRPLLTGFLREVDFAKIGGWCIELEPASSPEPAPERKPILERTRELQEIARANVERWKAEHLGKNKKVD